MVARRRTVLPALAAVVLVLAACRGARGGSAPTVSVTPCGPVENATRRDTASLTVTIRAEPAPPATAEAVIRLEGENERTTVRVNPAEGMRFQLQRGVYDARVTLDGYGSAVGRATLTGGCTAEMTVTLRR